MSRRAELCIFVPVFGKLIYAIGHVPSSKDPKFQHLLWCKFWGELWMKILSHRLRTSIGIALLHLVIDRHFLWHASSIQYMTYTTDLST